MARTSDRVLPGFGAFLVDGDPNTAEYWHRIWLNINSLRWQHVTYVLDQVTDQLERL